MHYRSIADLNDDIATSLPLIPPGIELVVGIPRSGLLAGIIMSLALNVPATDIEGYLAGRVLCAGRTRRTPTFDRSSMHARRVLVVDDSADTGASMGEARARLTSTFPDVQFVFCVVYGALPRYQGIDLVLKIIPQPRVFQWNIMHHDALSRCCMDIDGVLCPDPTERENDDGDAYLRFLADAPPLHTPTRRIGWLVTSRLAKYRPDTERWLQRRGIQYGTLLMLDAPSRQARIAAGAHAPFKAETYARQSGAHLFIESDRGQASEICRLSGKPVLALESQELFTPSPLSARAMAQRLRTLPTRYKVRRSPVRTFIREALKSSLSPRLYEVIRSIHSRG